ncbi:MAG: hypothetical protein WBB76_06580 [Gaiellaceae bacterium]
MSARALYLEAAGESFLALLHDPPAGAGSRAVLLCPQLGWDDVCSYRSRFEWAERLSARGFSALRLDFPGTGDSPGSHDDPRRLDAWTQAVAEAARLLQARGSGRVAGIGIGVGGLVLWRAVAAQAPVDELVLWGVPANGRQVARELRAFARVEADSLGVSDGQLAPGGFPQSAELLAELETLDLAALPLPRRPDRRALLLERDGLPVADVVVAELERTGADVATGPGPGYGEMLAEPAFARAPYPVFEQVDAWLGPAGAPAASPTKAEVESVAVDAQVEELPLRIEHDGKQLLGVLAQPERPNGSLCAVLLNAGAIRRIGPNRMWVDIARRWAALGVPTFRLDFAGIGDAEGDGARFADVGELYDPDFSAQIRAALDALQGRLGADSFLLVGLCSGGYWAFQGAQHDRRVVATAAINPGVLVWSRLLLRDRRLQPLRSTLSRSLARGDVAALSVLLRVVTARLRGRLARALRLDRLGRALDRLRDRGTVVLFLFGEVEPQLRELERDGYLARLDRWPNLVLGRLPGRDHTVRPPEMQRDVHAGLDRLLDDMLHRTSRRKP